LFSYSVFLFTRIIERIIKKQLIKPEFQRKSVRMF